MPSESTDTGMDPGHSLFLDVLLEARKVTILESASPYLLLFQRQLFLSHLLQLGGWRHRGTIVQRVEWAPNN